MDKKHRKLFTDWVLPIGIFIILYVTGWYKPLAVGMQQVVLSTGLIKPSIELEADDSQIAVDYNWQLSSLDGKPLAFESLRGKVVFLNYFATWCPPCVAEMPGIQGLYEELKDNKDIAFVIITRDESVDKARAFMSKKGYTMPVYSALSRTPEMLHTNVLPTTFIIAPDGRIVSSHEGMADYNNDKVKNSLKTLAEDTNGTALK